MEQIIILSKLNQIPNHSQEHWKILKASDDIFWHRLLKLDSTQIQGHRADAFHLFIHRKHGSIRFGAFFTTLLNWCSCLSIGTRESFRRLCAIILLWCFQHANICRVELVASERLLNEPFAGSICRFVKVVWSGTRWFVYQLSHLLHSRRARLTAQFSVNGEAWGLRVKHLRRSSSSSSFSNPECVRRNIARRKFAERQTCVHLMPREPPQQHIFCRRNRRFVISLRALRLIARFQAAKRGGERTSATSRVLPFFQRINPQKSFVLVG